MIPLKIEASFYDANTSTLKNKTFTIYISNSEDLQENDLSSILDVYGDEIDEKIVRFLEKKNFDIEDLSYEVYLTEEE